MRARLKSPPSAVTSEHDIDIRRQELGARFPCCLADQRARPRQNGLNRGRAITLGKTYRHEVPDARQVRPLLGSIAQTACGPRRQLCRVGGDPVMAPMLAYHTTGHQTLGSMALEFFLPSRAPAQRLKCHPLVSTEPTVPCLLWDPPKTMALPSWFSVAASRSGLAARGGHASRPRRAAAPAPAAPMGVAPATVGSITTNTAPAAPARQSVIASLIFIR